MTGRLAVMGMAMLIVTAAVAGCRSVTSSSAALPLASLREKAASSGDAVQPVKNGEASAGKAVALEDDQAPPAATSRWSRLLNPFGREKKRIPLPLSPAPADEEQPATALSAF